MDGSLSWRARSASIWRRGEPALLPLVAAALVVVVVGVPLVFLAAQWLAEGGLPPVLLRASAWILLGRSLMLAGGVTACSVVVGVPLGLLFGRTNLPGRRALWLAHAFPALLPPFLLALGWFHLLGRRGTLGNEATASFLFSDLGVVAVLAVALSPLVTTLVASAAQGMDPSLEEAARVAARPLTVLARVVLPATRPAVALGGILVFALAFAELGVPHFLRRDVYPAAVFARLGGIDYAPGEAIALCLPILPVAIALVAAERRWCGRRSFAVLGARYRERAGLPLGRWRAVAIALGLAAGLLALAPLLALLYQAAAGGGLASLRTWLGSSLVTTISTALPAAMAATVLGAIVGAEVIARSRVGAWMDATLLLAFVLPASILAVGLLAAWNRPATAWVYGGPAILALAGVARYSGVATRACAVAFAQSPASWIEAARAHGVRPLRRFVAVVLGGHVRGLGAAFVLTLAFVLRDLETAALLYPPGLQPLTVRTFTLEANGPESAVAALAVVQATLTASLLALASLLNRRRR